MPIRLIVLRAGKIMADAPVEEALGCLEEHDVPPSLHGSSGDDMVLSFHYRHGETLLHRSRATVKIIAYLVINLLISFSSGAMLLSLCGLLLLFCRHRQAGNPYCYRGTAGISLDIHYQLYKPCPLERGRNNAVFSRDPPAEPFLERGGERLLQGFFMLRVFAALIATDLLMFSTKIGDLQLGIYSIFAQIHRDMAWRLSIMLRIMFISLPVLMDSASSARNMLRLRGGAAAEKTPALSEGNGHCHA